MGKGTFPSARTSVHLATTPEITNARQRKLHDKSCLFRQCLLPPILLTPLGFPTLLGHPTTEYAGARHDQTLAETASFHIYGSSLWRHYFRLPLYPQQCRLNSGVVGADGGDFYSSTQAALGHNCQQIAIGKSYRIKVEPDRSEWRRREQRNEKRLFVGSQDGR